MNGTDTTSNGLLSASIVWLGVRVLLRLKTVSLWILFAKTHIFFLVAFMLVTLLPVKCIHKVI